MLFNILLATGLLGAAQAAYKGGYPAPYPNNKGVPVLAKFDDLTAGPLNLNPVGIYKYLSYEGFSVGTPELLGVQLFGVTPKSPPNVAYADAIGGSFEGPALNAVYTGSKTKSFDLKSFYYACVAVTNTPSGTAENCTVTVTGLRGNTQVATQSFFYGEDNILNAGLDAPMNLAQLDQNFKGLTEVDITYVQTNTLDTPPAFLLDNAKYTVYLKKSKRDTRS